jgi:hypothetical protein
MAMTLVRGDFGIYAGMWAELSSSRLCRSHHVALTLAFRHRQTVVRNIRLNSLGEGLGINSGRSAIAVKGSFAPTILRDLNLFNFASCFPFAVSKCLFTHTKEAAGLIATSLCARPRLQIPSLLPASCITTYHQPLDNIHDQTTSLIVLPSLHSSALSLLSAVPGASTR